MPITKDIFIKKFLKSLDNGDAAIFAGAGLSAPSGCVNWKELLKDIAEEIQPNTIITRMEIIGQG